MKATSNTPATFAACRLERGVHAASTLALAGVSELKGSSIRSLVLKRRERLVFTHKSKRKSVDESQRDSGPKPKVARHELPWVDANQTLPNPNRVAAFSRPNQPQPRWGWRAFRRLTQGSSCLATLGWRTQSLWDCPQKLTKIWVMTRPEDRAPDFDSFIVVLTRKYRSCSEFYQKGIDTYDTR
jgi:hypothetical protein